MFFPSFVCVAFPVWFCSSVVISVYRVVHLLGQQLAQLPTWCPNGSHSKLTDFVLSPCYVWFTILTLLSTPQSLSSSSLSLSLSLSLSPLLSLLQVIKNPVTDHLPTGALKICTSFHADELTDVKTYGKDKPIVFVVGAMAHGRVSISWFDEDGKMFKFEEELSQSLLDMSNFVPRPPPALSTLYMRKPNSHFSYVGR